MRIDDFINLSLQINIYIKLLSLVQLCLNVLKCLSWLENKLHILKGLLTLNYVASQRAASFVDTSNCASIFTLYSFFYGVIVLYYFIILIQTKYNDKVCQSIDLQKLLCCHLKSIKITSRFEYIMNDNVL